MERLDAFMARANAAYYANHDPFKDFTTAPEITQVFGELLGAWAAITWETMGRPSPVLLAECGPGRGTLMSDALRAITRTAPAFRAALHLHFVETSPRLRNVQTAPFPDAAFHETAETLPAGSLILLANEFLDALPIRQFVRRGTTCLERYVQDGQFVEQSTPELGLPLTEGDVAEICEPARALIAHLAQRLASEGGAALFLDYGPADTAPGDTLQAIRHGQAASPLADPGSADLTAHVDFAALAQAARISPAAVHGPIPQGLFLTRLGLFQRTDRLARSQPPARAAALIQAAQRLAEPVLMGRLFKAMCLCHPSLPTPPGFAE